MRPRPNTALRALTALPLVYGLLVLRAPRAGAQSTDSTHWSIFAGRTISSAAGADRSFAFPVENFGVGGSVDLERSLFPAPLRVTLSYDKFRGGPTTTLGLRWRTWTRRAWTSARSRSMSVSTLSG